jgi:5-methylcytosine-specific restriction endonuclease McrA
LARQRIFERDGFRCVYCAQLFPAEELTLDHVQPRARGGDRSGGNLVTACEGCNRLKGHRRLAHYLAENVEARRNFFALARHVWKRHLRAVAEEIERARDRTPRTGDRRRGRGKRRI